MAEIDVGDVLVTRGGSWPQWLVRIGAAMLDQSNLVDHVAVVSHRDDAGTWWVIEGKPGGVGYVDARNYLANRYTVNNALQPKTPEQRLQIAKVLVGMLGTPYDWRGIVGDAMVAIRAQELWKSRDWDDGKPPAQVVCSSLAAWVYRHVGLAFPTRHPVRLTIPADWDEFIRLNDFNLGEDSK